MPLFSDTPFLSLFLLIFPIFETQCPLNNGSYIYIMIYLIRKANVMFGMDLVNSFYSYEFCSAGVVLGGFKHVRANIKKFIFFIGAC